MGKYTPFISYLKGVKERQIKFKFTEIESLINDKLPQSARKHKAWWGNDLSGSHSWALDWCHAGWRSQELDLVLETVVFEFVGEYLDIQSKEALEGYLLDRTILAHSRNRNLVEERRRIDKDTCKVCKLKLVFEGKAIIEVHHLNPLSSSGVISTNINDLVCLCPTCHRIAHLRETPLTLPEIEALRNIGSLS